MEERIKVYKLPLLYCPDNMYARLLLANGVAVEGCGFGAETIRAGEVVFTRALAGYTSALTDPGNRGLILVEAQTMVGGYGVPSRDRRVHGIPVEYESDSVQVEGLVVAELAKPSHYASTMSLHEWLESEGVPGMYRVDTRFLAKLVREHGSLAGVIAVYSGRSGAPDWSDLEKHLAATRPYHEKLFALEISPKKPITHTPSGTVKARVSILDCGVKYGVLRSLLERGVEVTRYPCTTHASELVEGYDAVVLSNGPGNPLLLKDQAKTAAEVVTYGKPVLAVSLGMQLLALGLGATVYKLPYGHWSVGKPVIELDSKRCFLATHNHGYAVDWSSLDGTGLIPWFYQPDDGTLEGLRSRDGLVLATQFQPGAGPGPRDTSWIYDKLLGIVKG